MAETKTATKKAPAKKTSVKRVKTTAVKSVANNTAEKKKILFVASESTP